MSSIYLYIIYISRYISRPWFKGAGAALHGGRSENGGDGRQRIHIRNIHSFMPLLPLCYSTHKSSFCEEERVERWPSFSPSSSTGGKTDACQRVLIKNTPDVVRRPACFVVKGVVRVQGSGFRVWGSRLSWRLRRMLDDGILVSSAFPSRGRCPEGADRAQAV